MTAESGLPTEDEFGGKDFLKSESLTELAWELIREHEELAFIEDYEVMVKQLPLEGLDD